VVIAASIVPVALCGENKVKAKIKSQKSKGKSQKEEFVFLVDKKTPKLSFIYQLIVIV
jgi:hypothetical protein